MKIETRAKVILSFSGYTNQVWQKSIDTTYTVKLNYKNNILSFHILRIN